MGSLPRRGIKEKERMKTQLKDLLKVIDADTKIDVFYYSNGTIYDVDNIDLKKGIPDCLEEFEPLYVSNVKHKDDKIQIELEAPKKIRKSELLKLISGIDAYHNLTLSYKEKDVATITHIDDDFAGDGDLAEGVFDCFISDYAEDYYVYSEETPIAIELRFDSAKLVRKCGQEFALC